MTVGWDKYTEWHHNPSISELLIDGIDVLDIRPFDPGHAKSVLVLGLESYHRPTIGNLCICNNLSDVLHVVLSGLQISGLVGAEDV